MEVKKRVNELAKKLDELLPDCLDDISIVCIGTDRSTGDSLGPLVGKYLKQKGIKNVIGTLHDPCHAMNLEESLKRVKGKFVIGIDASLGSASDVGKIRCRKGPLRPGAGVGKELPQVGDIHIAGIVNVSGFMEYFVLQNTRLSLVDEMATIISNAICKVFKDRAAMVSRLQIAVGEDK